MGLGDKSGAALKAGIERRRGLSEPTVLPRLPGGDERGPLDVPDERWSFGGATAIETSAGVLVPEILVAGAGQATLYASLTPSGNGRRAAAGPAHADDHEPSRARAAGPGPLPDRPSAWRRCRDPAGHPQADCSAALARTAQIQRSGQLDPASQLPDQLTELCAVLTGHRPAGRLPASWSGMLDAARRADGPRHHLDIGAALPLIDGVAVEVDSLISGPGNWQLYLRAAPGWWTYSEDGRRKQNPVSVYAEDNLGGTYVSTFGDSTSWPHGYEELALRFAPRLDPLAHTVKLTFRGAAEEIPVDLPLESAATSRQE